MICSLLSFSFSCSLQLEFDKNSFCSFSRFLPASVYFPLISTARCFERSLREGEKTLEQQGEEKESGGVSASSLLSTKGGQLSHLFGCEGKRAPSSSQSSAFNAHQNPLLLQLRQGGDSRVIRDRQGDNSPSYGRGEKEADEVPDVLQLQSLRDILRHTDEKIKEIEECTEKIRTKGVEIWKECEGFYENQKRLLGPWKKGLGTLYHQYLALHRGVPEQKMLEDQKEGGKGEEEKRENKTAEEAQTQGGAHSKKKKNKQIKDINDMTCAVERDLHAAQTRQMEAATLLHSVRSLAKRAEHALSEETKREVQREDKEQHEEIEEVKSIQRYEKLVQEGEKEDGEVCFCCLRPACS